MLGRGCRGSTMGMMRIGVKEMIYLCVGCWVVSFACLASGKDCPDYSTMNSRPVVNADIAMAS